jgi:nitrogen fixation/metabolism regulation signal transduction histidine kinase
MKKGDFQHQILLLTKPQHISRLYKLITQMTEDLREKGVSEESIEKYLTLEVKQIISEA